MSLLHTRERRVPWLAGLVGLAIALGLFAAGYFTYATLAAPGKDVVARVNGDPITREQLTSELERQAGSSILQQMIGRRLVLQEMSRRGVQVGKAEIDAEMGRIRDQFPSAQAYEDALKRYGVTEEELRQEVELNLGVRALGRLGVSVSDAEVRQYFDANKESLGQPEQVRVRHILVGTRKEADDLLKQLKSGAAFDQLAREHSLDQASAAEGGDLGFISRGATVEPFETVAFKLKKGEYAIAQTPYGFHVLQVTDRREAKPAQFEQVKDEIRERLLEQKARTPEEILGELTQKASIEVYEPRYESLAKKPQDGQGSGSGNGGPSGQPPAAAPGQTAPAPVPSP
ncbi:peptidylprolyl isomerase [Carboxydochorda subterranea]|uniref:peptidylprolyl isomerase n=1 Tax=Carboxydichorda subterranea TaxID=3109565 RepID=A0ABZ1BX80_9FIRM|nr:peptidylprolyl isomerase [Limnochorda sp. L945t]WRP17090.1 peptidylprolyl isomerase [Limnochorda sp. L945t]